MSVLKWSDALALGLPFMDDTHREFVTLLAQVELASNTDVPLRWQELINHTESHFAQEDGWMRDTGFASSNCHTQQHEVVLSVMREGAQRALQGDPGMVRMMAQELATWFPNHAQTMDAALALHLRSVGLDPATGIVHQPAQLPQLPLRGCGSAACSP